MHARRAVLRRRQWPVLLDWHQLQIRRKPRAVLPSRRQEGLQPQAAIEPREEELSKEGQEDLQQTPGWPGVAFAPSPSAATSSGGESRRTGFREPKDRYSLDPDDPAGAPGVAGKGGVDPILEGRALEDALRR